MNIFFDLFFTSSINVKRRIILFLNTKKNITTFLFCFNYVIYNTNP